LIEAPAYSADLLALDPDVTYISLDAPVRSFGHVSETTGAEQVRGKSSLSV
jgi:hypothetical protein